MNLNLNIKERRDAGFTLLELLIVVSIIAILSVALIVVLNPAEALRKSRDSQRMSDLAAMKTALGLYLTSTSTPYLGTSNSNNNCKATPSSTSGYKIFYSVASSTLNTGATVNDGNSVTAMTIATTTLASTDGNGWIPVNLDSLTGGSPISNLPVDPVNTTASVSAVSSSDFVYRYACSVSPLAFEIDAILESNAYASSSPTTDGGNNSVYYEVGTNLKILGNTTTF